MKKPLTRTRTLSLALASLLISLAAIQPILAQPMPVNYAGSIPYNPFFDTTPTFYAVAGATTKVTPTSWTAEVISHLTMNATGTKSANIAFCSTNDITKECITLDFYNSIDSGNYFTGDLVYTDPLGASVGVGHFNYTSTGGLSDSTHASAETTPILLSLSSSGIVTLWNGTTDFVYDFIATPFTITYIAVSGNTASGPGNNYVTTAGYVSIWIGGSGGLQETSKTINAIIPLVMTVAVLGLVVGTMKGMVKGNKK